MGLFFGVSTIQTPLSSEAGRSPKFWSMMT